MKNKLMLLAIVIINISYWSVSERFIHGGTYVDGLIDGCIASAIFLIMGVICGSIVERRVDK